MPKQNENAILKVNMLTEYNVKSTNLNQFFDQLVVSAGNNTTVLYFTYIKLQSADLTTNDAFCHNFTSANHMCPVKIRTSYYKV